MKSLKLNSISENENEREGLGVSLKDTLTPSPRVDAAGGKEPATPSAEDGLKAIFAEVDAMPGPRDMTAYSEAFADHMEQQHPDAVPCPPGLLDAAKGVAV